MDERGWGWTASQLRQTWLVEWMTKAAATAPAVYVSVEQFYRELHEQPATLNQLAWDDLNVLRERSLVDLALGIGGIEGMAALPTSQARTWMERLQAKRADRKLRKAACRDAMVDWLYSRDATSELEMPARDAMLDDPRHGLWYAEPFTDDDLDAAAAWLHRQSLVKGITVDQCVGPVRLYLTDTGVTCAEDYESDTGRYMAAQRQSPGSGPILNIGNNTGPVQMAGDHAHQVQNIGASADELRALISGIAEMVRTLVPGAVGAAEQEQLALAAATPGKVDRSVLRRFADWAVSTVRAGATFALVPAITAATNEMMTEAGRLAGHI